MDQAFFRDRRPAARPALYFCRRRETSADSRLAGESADRLLPGLSVGERTHCPVSSYCSRDAALDRSPPNCPLRAAPTVRAALTPATDRAVIIAETTTRGSIPSDMRATLRARRCDPATREEQRPRSWDPADHLVPGSCGQIGLHVHTTFQSCLLASRIRLIRLDAERVRTHILP